VYDDEAVFNEPDGWYAKVLL